MVSDTEPLYFGKIFQGFTMTPNSAINLPIGQNKRIKITKSYRINYMWINTMYEEFNRINITEMFNNNK